MLRYYKWCESERRQVSAGNIHSYIVPDGIDDSDVALDCYDENSAGRRVKKRPERGAREPHATNELVVDAVTWHTSAVHLDNSRHKH